MSANMSASAIRLVVLGKTGVGKSSLANTIFKEKVFKTDASANAGTIQCKAATRVVNGRRIMWTDTPGFFDTKRPEEEMRQEILSCIVECAPGPHVFLIVLKVEKFTEQEQAVIRKLQEYFSDRAFKYAIVLFTHGDQLEDDEEIKNWAQQNTDLNNLLKTCGNRCHVFDNKYWRNTQDSYRNNQVQVEKLLKTVDELIEANDGGWYTNEKGSFLKSLIGVMAVVPLSQVLPRFLGKNMKRNQALALAFAFFIGKSLAMKYTR